MAVNATRVVLTFIEFVHVVESSGQGGGSGENHNPGGQVFYSWNESPLNPYSSWLTDKNENTGSDKSPFPTNCSIRKWQSESAS